jgi:deoxycytidine triphosphate deaminase
MVLGVDKLLTLVKEKGLVTGLSERELTNPEGCGFDLRIGEVYKLSGEGFLGETERKTPDATLVAKYEEGKKNSVVMKPGDYFIVKTIESVNVPLNLGGILYTRGTLFRSGIIHGLSQIAPGYSGQLNTALYNAGPCKVTIELGCRFIHVQFSEVKGKGSEYRGQWKGGRVAAVKLEKQV